MFLTLFFLVLFTVTFNAFNRKSVISKRLDYKYDSIYDHTYILDMIQQQINGVVILHRHLLAGLQLVWQFLVVCFMQLVVKMEFVV